MENSDVIIINSQYFGNDDFLSNYDLTEDEIDYLEGNRSALNAHFNNEIFDNDHFFCTIINEYVERTPFEFTFKTYTGNLEGINISPYFFFKFIPIIEPNVQLISSVK